MRSDDHPYGTYVHCRYDEPSCNALYNWCLLKEIPNPVLPEKYHSTILYSKAPLAPEHRPALNRAELRKDNWKFISLSVRCFPASDDGSSALVVELIAPQLEDLHRDLISKGGVHDFDEYIPHITIAYVPRDYLLKLSPPPVVFIPSSVETEPLDPNHD